VIQRAARKVQARFVIVDCGPSCGFMNQVIVTSCDYVLPVASPDFYSYNAVRALFCTIIPRWLVFQKGRVGKESRPEDAYQASTRVLSVVLTRFSMDTRFRYCLTRGQTRWLRTLELVVEGAGSIEQVGGPHAVACRRRRLTHDDFRSLSRG
jgi:cellulose biosynthesis protein BcsQ